MLLQDFLDPFSLSISLPLLPTSHTDPGDSFHQNQSCLLWLLVITLISTLKHQYVEEWSKYLSPPTFSFPFLSFRYNNKYHRCLNYLLNPCHISFYWWRKQGSGKLTSLQWRNPMIEMQIQKCVTPKQLHFTTFWWQKNFTLLYLVSFFLSKRP